MEKPILRPLLDVLRKAPPEHFGEGRGRILRKAVLLAIASCCDPDGTNAYPSQQTIADHALCSRRQAIRIIDELHYAGLLHIERTGIGKGRGRTNRYQINFDRLLLPPQSDTNMSQSHSTYNVTIKAPQCDNKAPHCDTRCHTTDLKPSLKKNIKKMNMTFSDPSNPPTTKTSQGIEDKIQYKIQTLFRDSDAARYFVNDYNNCIGRFLDLRDEPGYFLRLLNYIDKHGVRWEEDSRVFVLPDPAYLLAAEFAQANEPRRGWKKI